MTTPLRPSLLIVQRRSQRLQNQDRGDASVAASAAPDARFATASATNCAIFLPACVVGRPPGWIFDITVRSGSRELSRGCHRTYALRLAALASPGRSPTIITIRSGR